MSVITYGTLVEVFFSGVIFGIAIVGVYLWRR